MPRSAPRWWARALPPRWTPTTPAPSSTSRRPSARPSTVSSRESPVACVNSPRCAPPWSPGARRSRPAARPERPPSGNLDVEQRRVLLGAEEVALAHAAARGEPADGELDGVGGLEHHEVGHAPLVDAEQARHRGPVERAAVTDALEVGAVAADDVEGDVVDAGVLAADGRGQLDELHASIASKRVRNSSRGSLTSIAWLSVHSYAGRACRTSSDMMAAVPAVPFTWGSLA